MGEGRERPVLAKGRPGRPVSTPSDVVPGSVVDMSRAEFVELGLSPYEARVLVALLQAGSATAPQLTRLAEVPRTSTYQILDALAARRVAEQLPGEGPAVWASPGRQEVLARLEAGLEVDMQERMRRHRARSARLEELLADLTPDNPAVTLPFVHLLRGQPEVRRAYEQVLSEASSELIMFTRPPYLWTLGQAHDVILEMLARGVSARVLYQAEEWEHPSAAGFRTEMETYHRAGTQARLVDDLPIKLVVVDRRLVFASMPGRIDAGYPTTLLVDDEGYAAVQAAAFEHFWSESRPLTATADAGDLSAGEEAG